MEINRVNIAVIEPSDIVFEGLSTLIHKSVDHCNIIRLQGIEELAKAFPNKHFVIGIINPSALQNKIENFLTLKERYPQTSWLGLIYSFYSDEILNELDDTISIVGDAKLLTNKINTALNNDESTENGSNELTEREIEVLGLLAKGFANKEIADSLNISIHTVISHRKNLTEKTGIKSLPGLTIYAISNHIITL